jgi:putative glycosyltransferase (TIGR04372 family)
MLKYYKALGFKVVQRNSNFIKFSLVALMTSKPKSNSDNLSKNPNYTVLQFLELLNFGGEETLKALSFSNLSKFFKLALYSHSIRLMRSLDSQALYCYGVKYDIFQLPRVKMLQHLDTALIDAQLINYIITNPLNKWAYIQYANYLCDTNQASEAFNFVGSVICSSNEYSISSIWGGATFLSNQFYKRGYVEAAESFMLEVKLECDRIGDRTLGLHSECSYFTAIGHISLLEFMLKGIQLEMVRPDSIELIFDENKLGNNLLATELRNQLVDKGVSVTGPIALERAEGNLEILPFLGDRYIPLRRAMGSIENEWKLLKRPSLINKQTAPKNLERSEELLHKLGINLDNWFVGVHFRGGGESSRQARNTNLGLLSEFILHINALGGSVIRVGAKSGKTIKEFDLTPNHDLTQLNLTREESELLQWQVWSNCEFFVGNLSGGTHPPSLFGKPILWVDIYPLNHFRPPSQSDFIIPKRLYELKTGRLVPFSEMFSTAAPNAQTENPVKLMEFGYKLESVTKLDLKNASEEILSGIKNPHVLSMKQSKIQEIYKSHGFPFGANIPNSYLDTYPELVE